MSESSCHACCRVRFFLKKKKNLEFSQLVISSNVAVTLNQTGVVCYKTVNK